jgi:hypothetical protein
MPNTCANSECNTLIRPCDKFCHRCERRIKRQEAAIQRQAKKARIKAKRGFRRSNGPTRFTSDGRVAPNMGLKFCARQDYERKMGLVMALVRFAMGLKVLAEG